MAFTMDDVDRIVVQSEPELLIRLGMAVSHDLGPTVLSLTGCHL